MPRDLLVQDEFAVLVPAESSAKRCGDVGGLRNERVSGLRTPPEEVRNQPIGLRAGDGGEGAKVTHHPMR